MLDALRNVDLSKWAKTTVVAVGMAKLLSPEHAFAAGDYSVPYYDPTMFFNQAKLLTGEAYTQCGGPIPGSQYSFPSNEVVYVEQPAALQSKWRLIDIGSGSGQCGNPDKGKFLLPCPTGFNFRLETESTPEAIVSGVGCTNVDPSRDQIFITGALSPK